MPESDTTGSSDISDSSNRIIEPTSMACWLNGLAHDLFIPAVVTLVIVIVAAASLDSPSVRNPAERRLSANAIHDAPPEAPRTNPQPYQADGPIAPAKPVSRAAAYPYAVPLAVPVLTGYRPADHPMILQHTVYGQALPAHQQHWVNIRAQRAAVGQRIRQDRRYWLRQRPIFEPFQAGSHQDQENG